MNKVILLFVLLPPPVIGGGFDLGFLERKIGGEVEWLDLGVRPGVHENIQVLINDKYYGFYDVNFVELGGKISPCFSDVQLNEFGIVFSSSSRRVCVGDISEYAYYDYSQSNFTLNLYIPQKYIDGVKRNELRNQWDYGVDHVKGGYRSYVDVQIKPVEDVSGYFSSRITGSYKGFRFKGGGNYYQSSLVKKGRLHDFYIYNEIDSWDSIVKFGAITSGSYSGYNAGLPMYGMSIESDALMRGGAYYGYLPEIKGIVTSKSIITLKQGDVIIYSKEVPPGEFNIVDAEALGYGTELTLIVEEANGKREERKIPFSRLPSSLKSGVENYSLSLGQYRNSYGFNSQPLINFQYEYGANSYTPSFSILVSPRYNYFDVGVTKDLGLYGAISIESGGAWYDEVVSEQDLSDRGLFVKSVYAKNFSDTSTNIQLIGYQFRSEGFLSFDEYANIKPVVNDEYANIKPVVNDDMGYLSRSSLKNRFELLLNQNFSGASLYSSVRWDKYHDGTEEYGAYSRLNFSIGSADVGVVYSYGKNERNEKEQQLGVELSIPFDWGRKYQSSKLRLSYMNDQKYAAAAYGDSFGSVDYNLSIGKQVDKYQNSVSDYNVNLSRRFSAGNLSSSFYSDDYNTSVSTSFDGSVTLAKGNVIFGNYTGDTAALVDFGDGADGVVINNDSNTVTDSSGMAVVTYASPYNLNDVSFDDNHAVNVDVYDSYKHFSPRRGALSYIPFKALVGYKKLVKIESEHNLFGRKVVFDVEGYESIEKLSYTIGADNMVYLSNLKPKYANRLLVLGNTQEEVVCKFVVDTNLDAFNVKHNELYVTRCDNDGW